MKYPAAIWLGVFAIFYPSFVYGNDFSSFLTANASVAVVVDHDYMRIRGENILASFHKILSDTIRENLKIGGINVKYFTWNAVRLKKDFLAAMTVTDCENTWKFYEATKLTSILLIAITDGDCPRLPLQRALMVPLVGHGEEFPQMTLDAKMQQVLKWKTAIVLMDEALLTENDILVKSVVYENMAQEINPLSLQLYTIEDSLRSQRKRSVLRQLLYPFSNQQRKSYQFLIFSKFYEDIIEIAEGMNMFHIYNQWLFFILEAERRDFDAMTVTQNLDEGANIAFALNETLTDCVDSINCTMAEISMAFVTSISRIIHEEQSIQGKITDEEWEAIRLTKKEKQDQILGYMKDYLRENSKCSCSRWRMKTSISWGKSQEHRKYRAPSESSDSRNRNFEFVDVGYWSPLLGFVTQELLFPHVEHHFRNITMDIVTMHNPPWQIITQNSRGSITAHKGITMEILKELSRLLNFTYVLHMPRVTEVEEPLRNDSSLMGSLTHIIPFEVVEMVQGKNFFLAAVAVTIDEPEKKIFNYTMPISIQKYSFLTRRPDEISRIYLFTAPFTLETWACLAAVILITAPILYVINRLVPMEHLKTKGLCRIKNCFWYVYGALLQQGGMYLPKADSGRLVIGVWWIVVIVLVTTYCGNLVAFLTFPKFQPGMDYLNQLFGQNSIDQFGLRNGTFFEKYSSISTRDDYRRYLDRAIIYNSAQHEGIDQIEQGQRVNIDWRINLQLIIQNRFERDKECKFSLSKENFVDEQIGLIVPSNSPYLNLINEKITRMFQMGFIERWHQTNLPSMDKCNGKVLRAIINHKVNLDDMQGCFLVLLLGFMLALFVILIEYWYYHFYVLGKTKIAKGFSK